MTIACRLGMADWMESAGAFIHELRDWPTVAWNALGEAVDYAGGPLRGPIEIGLRTTGCETAKALVLISGRNERLILPFDAHEFMIAWRGDEKPDPDPGPIVLWLEPSTSDWTLDEDGTDRIREHNGEPVAA